MKKTIIMFFVLIAMLFLISSNINASEKKYMTIQFSPVKPGLGLSYSIKSNEKMEIDATLFLYSWTWDYRYNVQYKNLLIRPSVDLYYFLDVLHQKKIKTFVGASVGFGYDIRKAYYGTLAPQNDNKSGLYLAGIGGGRYYINDGMAIFVEGHIAYGTYNSHVYDATLLLGGTAGITLIK